MATVRTDDGTRLRTKHVGAFVDFLCGFYVPLPQRIVGHDKHVPVRVSITFGPSRVAVARKKVPPDVAADPQLLALHVRVLTMRARSRAVEQHSRPCPTGDLAVRVGDEWVVGFDPEYERSQRGSVA